VEDNGIFIVFMLNLDFGWRRLAHFVTWAPNYFRIWRGKSWSGKQGGARVIMVRYTFKDVLVGLGGAGVGAWKVKRAPGGTRLYIFTRGLMVSAFLLGFFSISTIFRNSFARCRSLRQLIPCCQNPVEVPAPTKLPSTPPYSQER
jgi:hypothetical protein